MIDTSPTALPSRRQLREQASATVEGAETPALSRRERRLLEQASSGSIETLPGALAGALAEPSPSISGTVHPPVLVPPPALDTPIPARDLSFPAQVVEAPTPAPVVSLPVVPPPAAPTSRRALREQQAALAAQLPPVVEGAPPAPAAFPAVPIDTAPVVAPPPATVLPPVFRSAAPSEAVEAPTAPSRSVGTAAPATNALILPTAPSMDLTGPIGDTGEILITGNIPLPKLVSEKAMTGLVDVDVEDDFVSVDTGAFTAPIRATQAVSTRSMEIDQPMIKKPSWGMASMVLAFSAAILGVTALGLLALALLTDIITLPF